MRVLRENTIADVALIQVPHDSDYHTARLGKSRSLEIGQDVVVIGTPLSEALRPGHVVACHFAERFARRLKSRPVSI